MAKKRFEIIGRFEHAGERGTKYYVEAEDFMAALEEVRKKSVTIAEALIKFGDLKFQMEEFRLLENSLPGATGAVITFESEE